MCMGRPGNPAPDPDISNTFNRERKFIFGEESFKQVIAHQLCVIVDAGQADPAVPPAKKIDVGKASGQLFR